jgi:23S rRNA pseudouridine1911/1915/1917 synthase
MPDLEDYPTFIPLEYQGLRSDVVLAKLLPSVSRNQITQWIKSGEMQLNHTYFQPKDKIRGGESIQWHLAPPTQKQTWQPKPLSLDISFEDEHILVINKPAGLVVHPGAGYHENTLVQGLLYYNPNLNHLPRAGIVHRLDKDTTGLLIVAKTSAAHNQLTRQLKDRIITRRYLALVFGQVISGGKITTAFGRDPRNRLKMAVKAQGREAITEYSIQQRFPHATLLSVKLHTGRTHQIRVHMRHIQHPIMGDPLYGQFSYKSRDFTSEQLAYLKAFPRQALHAYTLHLPHPILKTDLTFEAEIPEDFQQFIKILET